jgi:hypothetical protein
LTIVILETIYLYFRVVKVWIKYIKNKTNVCDIMLSQLHDIIAVNLEITQGLIGVMTVGIITAFFLIGYINRSYKYRSNCCCWHRRFETPY